MLGGACLPSKRSERGRVWGRVIGGWVLGGVLGGMSLEQAKRARKGFGGGGGYRGGSGLKSFLVSLNMRPIRPLLLEHLMFPPPPSWSQYSVLISIQ